MEKPNILFILYIPFNYIHRLLYCIFILRFCENVENVENVENLTIKINIFFMLFSFYIEKYF